MLPSAGLDGVGTSDDSDFRAQYPACACPCHRSTPSLTADGVWLRVGVVRYTFPVRLFHPLHSSRLLALSKARFPLAGWALAARESHPLDVCDFVWAHLRRLRMTLARYGCSSMPARTTILEIEGREVIITNPDKVFFPR